MGAAASTDHVASATSAANLAQDAPTGKSAPLDQAKKAGGPSSLVKVLMPLYYTEVPITDEETAAAKKTFNLIVGNQCKRFVKYKEEHPDSECKTSMQFMHACFFQRLFHVHPSSRAMFPHGTNKMDLIPILSIFFAKLKNLEDLKRSLKHFVDVHTRLGVKAVEFGIAGECAMHAIRAVVGPDLYTEQASTGWCKIFSIMLNIIIPAAVSYEISQVEKAKAQSVKRCQMVKDAINCCVVCVRLQSENESTGVKSHINQLCGFCMKGQPAEAYAYQRDGGLNRASVDITKQPSHPSVEQLPRTTTEANAIRT